MHRCAAQEHCFAGQCTAVQESPGQCRRMQDTAEHCRALQAVSTASWQSEQHHNPTLLTLSHHFPSLPSLNNLLFVVLVALGLILKSGGTTGSSLTTGLQPDSRSLKIVTSTTGILLLSSQ